jgi:predicted RNA polymerase sigma factor
VNDAGAGVFEDLLRALAPQVLGTLVRRFGQFEACEDAVQEALLAAVAQWPRDGVPDQPRGWLLSVAHRSLIDFWRRDSARRRRETTVFLHEAPLVMQPDDRDDTLVLLLLCCHPVLTPTSQIALTLRAVGGLSTAEIAAAFLMPAAAMAKRITRAKATILAAGGRFEMPPPGERPDRLRLVTHALYLVFNEGYTASSGAALHRADLTAEAIRLVRLLNGLVPDDAEVAGLLALMLLTDARRPASTDAHGMLVPLAEQDRALWNAAAIADGLVLLHRTLGTAAVGPYQVQAAIAALHDEAPTGADTDWPQILALYDVLDRLTPSPLVALSRAVAVAEVHGPKAALAAVGALDHDERMAHSHRRDAVRAHLLERLGDLDTAIECFRRAAEGTASRPEQRYLAMKAADLARRRASVDGPVGQASGRRRCSGSQSA